MSVYGRSPCGLGGDEWRLLEADALEGADARRGVLRVLVRRLPDDDRQLRQPLAVVGSRIGT